MRFPLEEKRHVGTQLARDLSVAVREKHRHAKAPSDRGSPPRHRCCHHRVPTASGTRFTIRTTDVARLAATADGAPNLFGGAPDEVGAVYRALRIGTFNLERAARRPKCQGVVQRHRLEDGPQLVIAVRACAEHAQRQVDLCERPDR